MATEGEQDRGDVVTEEKDTVKGAQGEDTVKGAEGEDTSKGAQGEDTAKGGEGEDTAKGAEGEDKRIRIPKHRFDEVVARAKADKEARDTRIADLEAQLKKDSKEDAPSELQKAEQALEKLDNEYETALADGDKAKAAEVRKQKRALEGSIVDLRADARAHQSTTRALTVERYNAAFARLSEEYPQINDASDEFDADLAQEVADLRDGAIHRGVQPDTALQRAVSRVLGKPGKGTAAGDKVREDRERKAREDALKAQGKTPARLDKLGLDSDKAGGGAGGKKSVMQMNQDEFAKLSDDQRAALRGDVL